MSVTLYSQNTVTGIISNANDNKPIEGATIYIADLKLSALSDADGKYTINNVPKSTFLVYVTAIGFSVKSNEINLMQSNELNFSLIAAGSNLDEVVVTGVAAATEQRTNPIPINILDQKHFLQNSATNLIDAIAVSPGASQITLGPNISKPIIRGLGYNRLITMNDGVRQEGQQWFDEFGIEIDEYSVNKVEVLKGPASLSYGSDAMAGVINMLSAPPLPEGKIKANLISNYQTNNGLIANSFNIAGNEKGFTWDVRATSKLAHAYQNRYDGYVWNSGFTENDIKGIFGINRKWGYSHLTLSNYDLQMGIIEGNRDSLTGKFTTHMLSSTQQDSAVIAPSNKYTAYNNFPIIHQHIRHRKAVLDNSFVINSGRINVRLGFQQNQRQEANDITQGNYYNNYFFLRTVNYYLSYVMKEVNHYEFSAGINGMGQMSRNLGTAFVIPEYNIFDAGAYAIGKKTLGKLAVSAGLRYDIRQLKGQNLMVDTNGKRLSDNVTPSPLAIQDFTAYTSNFGGWSGSAGLTYDITKEFYVKANVARAYRAPTAAESGANGIHDGTPFYEIGDHNLKAESSLQEDITLGYNSKELLFEVTAFNNAIDNYIFTTKLGSKISGDSLRVDRALPGIGPSPVFKYVQGNAILSGGEVVLNYRPSFLPWLSFNNSFSYVSAIQKNQPDTTKYLPFTPPPRTHSELKFSMLGKKTLRNAYFKIGADYFFVQNKVYKKFGDETSTPDYLLFNASVGGDLYTSKGTHFLSVFIVCNNLLDQAYQSNMSRLKYTGLNYVTGRMGVYNMGRNISFKVVIPIGIK